MPPPIHRGVGALLHTFIHPSSPPPRYGISFFMNFSLLSMSIDHWVLTFELPSPMDLSISINTVQFSKKLGCFLDSGPFCG